MRIGRLRERVTIQQSSVTADNIGGIADGPITWPSIATTPTVWARVGPIRGTERVQAMQLQSTVTHEVTIRYRTDLTAAMRLSWGTKYLNIRAILHDEKRGYTALFCEEGVSN